MPTLHCACLPHTLTLPPALAQFTPWVQSMPLSLGAPTLPCIWHILRARHCREVPLKPHKPGSGGPNIPTLRMGNPRLWGDGARSLSLVPQRAQLGSGWPDPDPFVPSSNPIRMGAASVGLAALRPTGSITCVWGLGEGHGSPKSCRVTLSAPEPLISPSPRGANGPIC